VQGGLHRRVTFWMNLQTRYELTVAERDHGARIAAEVDRAA
jgi:plasmid maintenance system antidote protein VapI